MSWPSPASTFQAISTCLVLSLALMGCSTINKDVASWEGSNIEDFIAANGGPTHSTQTATQTHYTWKQGQCMLVVTADIWGIIQPRWVALLVVDFG